MSVLEQYGLSVAGPHDRLPVVSIRGDKLNLLLEVVAAARAWAHGGPGEALRLSDAVAAYEAALPGGAK
jgi:hypothetical protein